MGDEESTPTGSRGIGAYLRRIRETRRLSLDAVEEMSVAFPERVTKSQLSRIENGQALPTFPRLHALGRIDGVPMATMAERYEVEARKAGMPGVDDRSEEEVRAEARRLRTQGLYHDAMVLYHALLERAAANGRGDDPELRLQVVNCLVHLGRYESAKLECEQLLGVASASPRERLITLHFFSFSSWKLGRLMPAMWGLEQAAREAGERGADERLLAPREHPGTGPDRAYSIRFHHFHQISPNPM